MPSNLLTALDVRNAKPRSKPYKLRDGKGLYLDVRPTGTKVWRYRYRIAPGEAEQLFTIGEAGDGADQVSLAKAREAREEARKLVKQGTHPRQHREIVKANKVREGKNTFKALAEEWLEESAPSWTADYATQTRRGLKADIYPAIGNRPIRSITSADVLAVLKTRRKHAAIASNMRSWIGSVFRYAIAQNAAEIDPTYALRGAVKQPKVKHRKPLPLKEMPAFMTAVRAYGGQRQTAIAGELLMLTFVRPGELCGARWAEFDLDGALWIVPAERMKMKEPHYVPLSDRAVALLRELHKLTGKREHLFPNVRDPKRPMEQGTLNLLFEKAGYKGRFSPHGCRATASTELNGMGFRPDVIERQLAHAPRNEVRASYNQQEYLSERRTMMQTWADVIEGKIKAGANVIPLRGSA